MRQIVSVGLLAGLVGSGCGSGAGTNVTSSRQEVSFHGVEATRFSWSFELFAFGDGPVQSFPVTLERLVIAERPGYCGQAQRNVRPASITGLVVDIQRAVSNPLVPGRYTLFRSDADGLGGTSAQLLRFDASCTDLPTPSVLGGTVTIDHVDPDSATGSVDVLLSDDTRIQGAFDAPTCDAGPPFPTTQLDGGVREVPEPTCAK